jgi:hypothetical protein
VFISQRVQLCTLANNVNAECYYNHYYYMLSLPIHLLTVQHTTTQQKGYATCLQAAEGMSLDSGDRINETKRYYNELKWALFSCPCRNPPC